MKSVCIWSFSGPYFPTVGLNTNKPSLRDKYRIRSFSSPYFSAFGPYSVWMRKNTDQKNSEYEHFSRSDGLLELQNIVTLKSEKASWKWTEETRSRRLWNKIWVCQINCNTTLEECKVINPDGISDYITKDHFDGLQIILSLSKLLKEI